MGLLVLLLVAVACCTVVIIVVAFFACARRCQEHRALVLACAAKYDAHKVEGGPGRATDVVGVTATYGPGLAPLEFATLTGLIDRFGSSGNFPPPVAGLPGAVTVMPSTSAAMTSASTSHRAGPRSTPQQQDPSQQEVVTSTAMTSASTSHRPGLRSTSQQQDPSQQEAVNQATVSLLPGPDTEEPIATVWGALEGGVGSHHSINPRRLPELQVQKLPNVHRLANKSGSSLASAASHAIVRTDGP